MSITASQYQLVIDWASYVERAGKLALSLTPDTETQTIIVEEAILDGDPVAHIKLEVLGTWLDGYEKACKVIGESRPLVEGVPIEIVRGEIWLRFTPKTGGGTAAIGIESIFEKRNEPVPSIVRQWAAEMVAKLEGEQ